jgi:transcriptional regulator with XRE-family HTH domain
VRAPAALVQLYFACQTGASTLGLAIARGAAYGNDMDLTEEVLQEGLTGPSGKAPRGPRRGPQPDAQAVEDPHGAAPPVGRVLRRAREHWRLSLREVERRTGRSNAYISQVERGLIRRPDPLVLLELANLYGLNFRTLAEWAGWSDRTLSDRDYGDEALRDVLRLVLQLEGSQRAQLLAYLEELLRETRT